MAKKYRFRKMYFVSEDKSLIQFNVHATNAYQFRDTAEAIAKQRNEPTMYLWEQGKPKPVASVHGYYLVHESLFDEILKHFSKDDV